jgi:hypothetical protein
MRMIASVAAAAVALGLSAGMAFAVDDEETENRFDAIEQPADTLFDLGIDVAPIANSPAAVRAYLASLPALTRGVILSTCEHYMTTPSSTRERDTIAFCSIAVGG